MEGFNSFLKRCQTYRKLMPLGSFNKMMFRLFGEKSAKYQDEEIPKTKLIKNKYWKSTNEWKTNTTEIVSVYESISTSKYYIILSANSTENDITPALRDKYNRMQADDLDSFIRLMKSMSVPSLTYGSV